MIAATITAPSRIDRALALADSFVGQNPEKKLLLVVLGDRLPDVELPRNVEAMTLRDTGADYDAILQIQLDAAALQRALIAPIAARLLSQEGQVLVLADSLLVTGNLDVFGRALDQSAAVAVADPLARTTSADALAAMVERGTIHPGAFAFGDCNATRELLAAWPTGGLAPVERLPSKRDAFQAWCDALPQLPNVGVLDPGAIQTDAGLAVAAGDAVDAAGLSVSGMQTPLIDLAEFDVRRPHLVSTASRAARLSKLPVVADLIDQYGETLASMSNQQAADPWTSLADGTPLTPLLRRLSVEAIEAGKIDGDIFSSDGTEALHRWLAAPATMGAAAGLNRYHEAIWEERIELRATYPHLDGPDGFEYAGWLNVVRPPQVPLPAALAPPMPEPYAPLQIEPFSTETPRGVNVTGLLSGILGLGESARRIADTLNEVGVPTKPVQGRLRVPGDEFDEFEFFEAADAPFAINLVCLNGDTLQQLARDIGDDFFKRRYTIALWWWELPELPADWFEAFDLIDEVWVASDFIHEIVAPVSPVPVHKVRMPVVVAPFQRRSRAELGMPDDFVFLFVHDYHSTVARKNPVGLIKAFRRAFPDGSGASLVIKSINGDRMPHSHEAALLAARGREDIHFIDGFVDSQTKNAMIETCDCYVSLHRSEGFGLTIAEAMWLGKPAIATGYGGNLDFMTAENSYLVEFGLVEVGEDAFPYPADGVWAEPNIEQAAALMREVFENPEEAAARGVQAAADIRRENGVQAAGGTMARRLETIHGCIKDDPAFVLNPEIHEAPVPASSSAGAARIAGKQFARKVAGRLERLMSKRQR